MRLPEVVPKPGGVKTTLIEQVPPAAKVLGDFGQLFVWLKFALAVMELMVRGTFWTFFRVMVFAELLLPKVMLPNERLLGERETGETPVPARLIVCGLLLELSEIEIDPLKLPAAMGLKVTLIVQYALGASEARQLLLSEKGEGGLGGVMPVITRGAVPVFVRRTDLRCWLSTRSDFRDSGRLC